MMCLLDTNVLVRFLVGDNPAQQAQARTWFQEAEHGEREILVPALVVAETTYVLESFYKLSRAAIAEALTVLLSQEWLIVEEREAQLALWPWYRKKFHFVDSYLLALSKNSSAEILSFDVQLRTATGKKSKL